MDLQEQNKLLYARAGFGISPENFKDPKPIDEVVASLFPNAAPGRLELVTPEEWAEYNPKTLKTTMPDEVARKEKEKEFRRKTGDMNLLWMEAMVRTSFPLLEKMSMFWHGHFATKVDNPYFDQLLLNDIRKNALGNFGDMLRAVSKSSAMIRFLNNQQNKKSHPNENFAREVMELFTLGRGHYTEDDVKEGARAFTGWTYDDNGEFIFRRKQHDADEKKFLGQKGNFDGDDILNILLQQKQTAVFITQKIYRYFVSDEKIDNKHVNALAKSFYDSNYDIAGLLKEIFSSKWFYSNDVVGAKIKSPVELLVAYQRMIPMSFKNPNVWINLQRVLGQYLFNPPNVAGWPGGKDWIDSSSLVIRMRLPEAFFASKELDLNAKEIEPEMMKGMQKKEVIPGQAAQVFRVGKLDSVDWTAYLAFWKSYKREEVGQVLADYLLPGGIEDDRLKQVQGFADNDSYDEYIKSMTILLMELPEYQLC